MVWFGWTAENLFKMYLYSYTLSRILCRIQMSLSQPEIRAISTKTGVREGDFDLLSLLASPPDTAGELSFFLQSSRFFGIFCMKIPPSRAGLFLFWISIAHFLGLHGTYSELLHHCTYRPRQIHDR